MKPQFILTPYFLDQPSPQLEALAQPGWIINRPPLPGADVQSRLSVYHAALAEHVTAAIADKRLPVSIAGDCCATIGVLAGLQRAGLAPQLLWFDAHGDFNTWETTPSGFLGGMPLAMLAGLGEQTMMQAVGAEPLAQERIILSDGRDLDPEEAKLLAGCDVVHLRHPGQLLDFDLGTRPLYVHFDTDVLNPLEAPAMRYAAAGGPSADELARIFRRLAQTGQIAAVSMTTWTPELDTDGRSQETCLRLLPELWGAA
ncbi:MAG TPA: arginase family protein [Chloroflexota bacterium]|nr:arginase family protein [Chloroflexota bacterium]